MLLNLRDHCIYTCAIRKYDNRNIKCICNNLHETINANDCGVRLLTPRAENNNECKGYFLRWFGLKINVYVHRYAYL